jgi:hypothetical protein
VGNFVDGRREGEGKMNFAGGEVYDGLWEDGQPAQGATSALPEAAEVPTGPEDPTTAAAPDG